jgi:hypothetical protein
MHYYCASILNKAPDSLIKARLAEGISLSIHKQCLNFSPKESDQEIYDILISCLHKFFGARFIDVKSFIDKIAKERPLDCEFLLDERFTLTSYFNEGYTEDDQILCINLYRGYLMHKLLSTSSRSRSLKLSFGIEWERFKKRLVELESAA